MSYDLKIHRIVTKIVLSIHIMGGMPWNLGHPWADTLKML